MQKNFIIIIILTFIICHRIASPQNGNTGTVNGFVYDVSNGESLIGANILLKSAGIGTSTNTSGYFVITAVPEGAQEITVSYIGYKTYSKKINVKTEGNTFIKINMEPDAVKIGEIVTSADSVRTIEKLYAKPISKVELNTKQINSIPRAVEPDLLRTLQTLPGIMPLSDFSSALYIRGGTPDQNLFQVDGTDIYNPEHAFGLFSTFNTSAIKKAELSKGGFGAEYGGRLSSVLSVTNLDGNRNRFEGELNISAISASATLQSPLWDFGSVSGSFRRTYIDQTYARFVKEIPDYYFYDGNLKAAFDLGDNDKLYVSYFGSKDNLHFVFDKDIPSSPQFDYFWGNNTGSINYRRVFSPNLFGNFWLTGSEYNSKFVFNVVDFEERNLITDISFKSQFEHILNKRLRTKYGFETKFVYGELFEQFQNGRVDGKEHRKLYSGNLTAEWMPVDQLQIDAGLRYDYFDSDADYQNFDPRFSVKYRLNDLTSFKLATGIYHQYVTKIPRLFLTSIWLSADEYTKGSSAYHLILGAQREIAQIYEFEIEAYYKKYNNVYSFNQTFITESEPSYYDEKNEPVYNSTKGLFNHGDGYSYGLELLLRKDYGAVTGWLGFSLSRTENKVYGLNQDKLYVPRHDRTFAINSVTNIDLGAFIDEVRGITHKETSSKWLINMNFIYTTGQPITLPGSVYTSKYLPDWTNSQNIVNLYPTTLNDVRLPAYTRLDLSITWQKNYETWSLAPYIQVFNVGNRENVWFIQYENKVKNGIVVQEISPVNMLPILPSFGVNIKF